MYKLIIVAIMSITISAVTAAERKSVLDIEVETLIQETQKQIPDSTNKHLALVWWVPVEFWQSALGRDPSLTASQRDEVIDALRGYFLLAIVQADISTFGAFEYYTKAQVKNNLNVSISRQHSNKLELEPLNKLEPNIDLLLNQITPILASAMGNLGDNFHFYVFEDSLDSDSRKVDPYLDGLLSVALKKQSGEIMKTNIEMPLDSLFVARICPNGKKAHVTWKFCPWSGEKLN